MSKQEEIREGIKQITHPQCYFVNTKCIPQKDSVDLGTEQQRQNCIRCRIETDSILSLMRRNNE